MKPQTDASADHTQSLAIASRMRDATRKLHAMAVQVGNAKAVREYDGDRRKQILAVEVVKSLKAGESAAAADAIGRASESYKANLEALAKQYEAAEVTIAQWIAEQCSYECARSLLSFSRETIRQL